MLNRKYLFKALTLLVVGVLLLAAHELAVGSSAPALRAAIHRVPARTWLRVRAVAIETALVLLGCTIFVCVLMWPVVQHLSSTIIGSLGSDSTGSVSFFWTLQHESGFHLLGRDDSRCQHLIGCRASGFLFRPGVSL